ncbi:6670_t:CDS:2 [Ambispora leptoticha]|uniref:6670_t:CDS:1 n=1 Tax=Ambispora leptoticha TaxID=144679 RepID=A0A9N9DKN3_9GLOM|nr:6670_t:CDS:2 [Ambispora leptoticha]
MDAKRIFGFLLMVVVLLSIANADTISLTAPANDSSVKQGSTTAITVQIKREGMISFNQATVTVVDTDTQQAIETVLTATSSDLDPKKNKNSLTKNWVVDPAKYEAGKSYTITLTGEGTYYNPKDDTKENVALTGDTVDVTVTA